MLSKNIVAALLTTALTGVASAQSTTDRADTANVTITKMHQEGEWRASKLAGVSVYNDSNEKIGDINDVILDKSGKATNVILGVGGFLGMREHYVAVTFDQLKWVDQPVRTTSSTSTAPASGTATMDNARTTTGSATTTTSSTANENWYPDHAVLNANKGQLMTMPEFKY
jgi:hypothetical protein